MGRNQGGEQAIRPAGPSISTSRTSAAVRATMAPGPIPSAACARAHSTIVRVLPNPRPASSSQVAQSPAGGSWLARAQKMSQA